jgi:hypothetical protein
MMNNLEQKQMNKCNVKSMICAKSMKFIDAC